jgi:hypothetical protein
MNQRRVYRGILIFMLVLPALSSVSAQQAPPAVRIVGYEDAFKMFDGRYPKWQNGHLVSWKWETSAADSAPNIALYNREGKIVGSTRIWLDDAVFIRILDASVRADGDVAVVGWATTNQGLFAAFFGQVSVKRGVGQIVRTSPFEGRAVTFAPDGSIWVLGLELGPGRGREPAANHYMVQHFGKDYVLKEQHLLRSDFSCELAAEGNMALPSIVVSNDRIGLFAPRCRMWVELSLAGELLGQWTWNALPARRGGTEEVTAVALTSRDELFGWKGSLEPGLVRFGRTSHTWIPMGNNLAPPSSAISWLQGSEGEMLVSATVDKKLVWYKPVTEPQTNVATNARQ